MSDKEEQKIAQAVTIKLLYDDLIRQAMKDYGYSLILEANDIVMGDEINTEHTTSLCLKKMK
jgi:hypothetical protein